jgi:modulator of FtsH protease
MYQSQRPQLGAVTASTPALLGQVLGITGAGFLVTAITAFFSQNFPYGASLIAMLVGFGFLIAISATRGNPGLSMLMYYAFTACEGIGIGPVIANYARIDGSGVVVEAAATTGVGMLTLVVVGLISAFTHFLHPQVYAWLTLAVFTLLVLVDFARIRAGGGGQTAIELAVSIYLDSINIFLALLSIFSGGRSRR